LALPFGGSNVLRHSISVRGVSEMQMYFWRLESGRDTHVPLA
jgi:hypothetical protein